MTFAGIRSRTTSGIRIRGVTGIRIGGRRIPGMRGIIRVMGVRVAGLVMVVDSIIIRREVMGAMDVMDVTGVRGITRRGVV